MTTENYINDPFIKRISTKEEFKKILKKKMKNLNIGEILKVIVNDKLRVLKKVSNTEVRIMDDCK